MKIFGYEITRSKMEKFVELSGGGNAYGTPPSWMTSYLGPGQPISPITPSSDVEVPRTIDYPISVNSQLTPRSGYGLMPFSQLMLAYEKVPECRFPVNLIHRQLSSYIPKLVDKNGNVIKDHPYSWMTNSPDGRNPWSVWMTRYLKSAKIYDAPALYIQRDHNGSIAGLDFIDGSTLFVIVDERGNTPIPERVQDYVTRRVQDASYPTPPPMSALIPNSARGPATVDGFIQQYNRRLLANQSVPLKIPAYTQVIKGTPYSWWSSDDIWYMPESRRVNAPYGEPFIEAAWPWVMIVVNLTAFELAHYRTGNMPEGYVTLPRDWLATPDQLEALEIAFNQRMTRNPVTERNRIRLFPDGSKWFQTKRGDWPESLYDRARGNILDEIGIPPAEAGDIPGKGLGGKGFKEGGTVELNRNTINPNRITVLSPFNWTLQHDGVSDVTLTLEAPLGEIDPQKLKETVYDGMTHGTYSLNDGRSLLNLQPIGDVNDPKNIANKHMIVAGAAIYVIEDMEVSQGMAVPTFTGQQSGGQPAGPETAMQKYGAEHTVQDYSTLEQAMLHAQEGGTLDGKSYWLVKAFKEEDRQRDSHGRWIAGAGEADKVFGRDKKGILDTTREAYEKAVDYFIGLKQGKLNRDQAVAVDDYSLDASVNAYLRNHDTSDEKINKLSDSLSSAISQSSLDEPLSVFRGVRGLNLSEGQEFSSEGFTSVSVESGVGAFYSKDPDSQLMQLHLDKGTNYAKIDNGMSELVLQKGLKFKVDREEPITLKTDKGQRSITLLHVSITK